MNANLMNGTIEMNKTEAKEAGKLNSEKFKELKGLLEQYPGYQVVVKSTTKSRDHFKGLTAARMEKFIKEKMDLSKNKPEEMKKHQDNLVKLYEMRGLDENGKETALSLPRSYGEIRAWFLYTYSEVEDKYNEVDKILNEAKKKRAAQRAAAKAAA